MKNLISAHGNQGPVSGFHRRDLFRLGGIAALTAGMPVAVGGCTEDPLSSRPADDENSGKSGAAKDGGSARQAPALEREVKAGNLPPLKERLPSEPAVIHPVERLGSYGGQWRTMLTGLTDTSWISACIAEEKLLTWDEKYRPTPNLAKSFNVSDNGTTFTLKLRAGVHWSDGEEFTVDDVVFAYEDIVSNRDITPVHPAWMSSGGTPGASPARLERVDDRTVRFVFDEPNGLFLPFLVAYGELTRYPKHYLKQFHKTYNPKVDGTAKEEGFSDWIKFFQNQAERWQHVDVPVLTPWVTKEPLGAGGGQRFVVERNPYYWKTDPEGHQLPYLDRVNFQVGLDSQVMVLKLSQGEVDFHARHVMSPQNKPVFARNRKKGDYHLVEAFQSLFNVMGVLLNLSTKNLALREVFQKKDFRIALSHAINRQEIIDTVFQRQGEPWQFAPRPDSPYHNETFAKQYTEYDPELANDMLDGAGFRERNSDGIRLRSDGKPISFQVDVGTPSLNDSWVPATQLVKGYWRKVGIDIQVKSESRSLFFERVFSNQHDAASYQGEFGDRGALLWPDSLVPTRIFAMYAVGWGIWNSSGGEDGVEPPAEVKRQLDVYVRVRQTADPGERDRLFREVLKISQEQFYAIGTSLPPPSYGIVKNSFHNVPDVLGQTMLNPPTLAPPEQFFSTA